MVARVVCVACVDDAVSCCVGVVVADVVVVVM